MNMTQYKELKKIEAVGQLPQGAAYYSTEYKRIGNSHLSWYNFYNSEFEVIGSASAVYTNLLAGIVRITQAERKNDAAYSAYKLTPASDDRFYIVESQDYTGEALKSMADGLTSRGGDHPKTTNLKAIRQAENISQAELAELAGVSLRTLQDYEQRHKDINSAKGITLYKLSRALGCEIIDLLELND